jgi:hypothetical protein
LACAVALLACNQGTPSGGHPAGSNGGGTQAMAGHGGGNAGAGGVPTTGGAAGSRDDAGLGGKGSNTGVGGSALGGASTGGRGDAGVGGAGAGGGTGGGAGVAGRADAGLGGSASDAISDSGAVGDGRPPDGIADAVAGSDLGTAEAGTASPCQEPPTIFPWTTSWGLPHASKAVLACGVYVIGSSAVADAALLRAQQIVQVELRKVSDDMPDVPAKLTASHSRLVILGAKEDQSIYWSTASGRRSFCSWPDNKKMIEATTLEEELTSNQRSLLMTTVHEMGHFTQFIFYAYNKSLYDRSVAAFNACTKSLYNDYDLQDPQEFFAGDALRWFDLNPSDLAVSDAKSLSQRAQVQKYDPTMYQIMSDSFVTTAIP